MPFEIRWHVPYRVIEIHAKEYLNKEDMLAIAQHLVKMLTEAETHAPDHLVYLLYDSGDAKTMPPLYMMLKQALPVLRFKNRGPLFHVTRSKSIRSIMEITAHVANFQLRSFMTREEALHMLEAALLKDDFHHNHR